MNSVKPIETPVTSTQKKHVSIRYFNTQPIADDMLRDILDAARRAPTSSNMQAYSIIQVKDAAKRDALVRMTGNQEHVAQAAEFLIFCADVHRLSLATSLHDVVPTQNLESFLIASIDASLVGMSAMTAAEFHGLGAVMIGAIRNDLPGVAQLLELPQGVYPVFGLCLGWPEEESIPPQKPRLPHTSMVHGDRYDPAGLLDTVEAYDRDPAAHYNELERNAHPQAWSGVMAKILSKPLRPEIKRHLSQLGFHI